MNSQQSPERERNAARLSPPRSFPPRIGLPRGIRLIRADGSFYTYEGSVNLIGTSDGYIIGLRDFYGVLRPFFYHRYMVKIKCLANGSNRMVPLTSQEYRYYNYNSDVANSIDRYVQYIRERRG